MSGKSPSRCPLSPPRPPCRRVLLLNINQANYSVLIQTLDVRLFAASNKCCTAELYILYGDVYHEPSLRSNELLNFTVAIGLFASRSAGLRDASALSELVNELASGLVIMFWSHESCTCDEQIACPRVVLSDV